MKGRLNKLEQRTVLTMSEYEEMFFEEPVLDDMGNVQFSDYQQQNYALSEIVEHQRKYIKVEKSS